MAFLACQVDASSSARKAALDELVRPALWQRYPLLFFTAILLAGGYCGTRLEPFQSWGGIWVVASGLFLACGGLLWFKHRKGNFEADWPRNLATICGGIGVLMAGIEYGASAATVESDALFQIANRAKQPFAFRATISASPIWTPNPHHRPQDSESSEWRTQWKVRCTAYRHGQQWLPVEANSTLSVTGRVVCLLPGDEVEVYGSLKAIGTATNPGDFNPAEIGRRDGRFVYLAADDVGQIKLLASNWKHPIRRLRGHAVRNVDRWLHRWVSHDQAPLAAALVFGQRQQVNWEDQQELMATGTLHMLAISGMHVEIVAAGVLGVCWLLRFGGRVRLMAVIFVIVLYAALADAKPPVVRAAVLVLTLELARHFGRPARLANLLSLAAILIFLMQANHLENAGVHLSFLAVAAIGLFVIRPSGKENNSQQLLQNLLAKNSGAAWRISHLTSQWIWAMLRLSFWVWLISSPLVWYHFHIVAPIAIPLNLVISIPLGLALLSGLVTGVFGWLPWVGAISGSVCGQSLELISWLVAVGKQVAGGHIWLPEPPLWWIILFYAGIGAWLIVFKFRARVWLASGLVLWLILGIASFAMGPRGFAGDWFPGSRRIQREPYLAATFLDVGHGTSVVIELPDGRVWLYDAGHLGSAANSHRSIAAALWEMRVARVDRLILSHADSDHYNAVRGLVERFRIGCITSTDHFWRSEDVAVQRLVDELRNRRIHCETWASGDTDVAAGAKWQVLHPTADFRGESDNANSLCLLLSFGDKRILLPGDLDGSGLLDLMKLPARPCHVLMAPHHGSLTRDPTELLRWCRPELVVISGNHRAVRPAVIERFQPWTQRLAVTFRDGAVRHRVFANQNSQSHHWHSGRWLALD